MIIKPKPISLFMDCFHRLFFRAALVIWILTLATTFASDFQHCGLSGNTLPQSEWRKTISTRLFKDIYSDFVAFYPRIHYPTQPGSIAALDPETLNILNDLDMMMMNRYDFNHHFKELKKIEAKPEDYTLFISERFVILEDGIREIVRRMKLQQPPFQNDLDRWMVHEINRIKYHIDILQQKPKSRPLTADEITHQQKRPVNEFKGLEAELRFALQFKSIQRMQVQFSELPDILKKIQKIEGETNLRAFNDSKFLSKLLSDYSNVFSLDRYNEHLEKVNPKNFVPITESRLYSDALIRKKFIEFSFKFISDKEADFIVTSEWEPHTLYFYEIKGNSLEVDVDNFKSKHGKTKHGSKSIYEQYLEYVQIRKLLGLTMKWNYQFSNGADEKVISVIEADPAFKVIKK
jgi:hypothetical protein